MPTPSEPTIVTSLRRVQTDPDSGAHPTATAFFGTSTTFNGQTFEAPWTSVTWPLLEPAKSVTLSDGTVLSYAQVSEGVTRIAYQEKYLADNPPAPEPVVEPVVEEAPVVEESVSEPAPEQPVE